MSETKKFNLTGTGISKPQVNDSGGQHRENLAAEFRHPCKKIIFESFFIVMAKQQVSINQYRFAKRGMCAKG